MMYRQVSARQLPRHSKKTNMRGDEEDMAMVYAALIIKGKKTWAQVPDRIKPEVRQALIDLDCEYLIPQE